MHAGGVLAAHIFDIAHRLVAQCRMWDQQERAGELQGSLALLWPREMLHWECTLQELRPVRARLYWQAGQVGHVNSGQGSRFQGKRAARNAQPESNGRPWVASGRCMLAVAAAESL